MGSKSHSNVANMDCHSPGDTTFVVGHKECLGPPSSSLIPAGQISYHASWTSSSLCIRMHSSPWRDRCVWSGDIHVGGCLWSPPVIGTQWWEQRQKGWWQKKGEWQPTHVHAKQLSLPCKTSGNRCNQSSCTMQRPYKIRPKRNTNEGLIAQSI